MSSSGLLLPPRVRWPRRFAAVLSALVLALAGLVALDAPAAHAAGGPLVYTANRDAGTVSVIDTSSNTVTATIPVGAGPAGIAENPARTRVYVSNNTDSTVSVIDTSTNTVTATIPGITQAFGMTVTPSGAQVYVIESGTVNKVAVIDTATNTVTGTPISVGTSPYHVLISPDGAKAYVTNNGSNTVSVISTATRTVTATIAVGTTPLGLKTNPAGTRLYVANRVSNSVSVIDTSTNAVVATIPVGVNPQSLAVSPDGTQVYAANQTANTVSVINAATNAVTATVPVGVNPLAVAFNPAGTRAYVPNGGAATVSVIDTSTRTVTATIPVGARPYEITPDGVLPVPAITGVSPASGPVAGGNPVTITGTDLSGASVSFGTGHPAGNVSCSATSCTAAVPAGTLGTVDVQATTAFGTSPIVAADRYTYAAPLPTITSMDPNIAAASGPNTIFVFLYGTNLAGATSITFGPGHPATNVYCEATMCNMVAPAQGGGTVDVRVTTPAGTSAITSADKFTYQSAATLSSITPASGPTAGGTRVTVTGTDLTGAVIVFGSKAATNASCTATSCTVTTPAQSAAGTYAVSADNTVGAGQNTLNFTATAPPTVTAVSPASGPTAGGSKVTITGTNLAIVDGVSFGPGRWVQYGSCGATSCTVTVPPGPGGPVDVQVYGPGGTSAVSSADRYTYLLPPPTVTAVSPSSGPSAGGNTITVTGTNLSTAIGVKFGPAGASSTFSCTATTCTVTVPHVSGSGLVDIQIATPSGTSPVVAADHYTFTG